MEGAAFRLKKTLKHLILKDFKDFDFMGLAPELSMEGVAFRLKKTLKHLILKDFKDFDFMGLAPELSMEGVAFRLKKNLFSATHPLRGGRAPVGCCCPATPRR